MLIYPVLLEGFDPQVNKSPFLCIADLTVSVLFLSIISNTQVSQILLNLTK